MYFKKNFAGALAASLCMVSVLTMTSCGTKKPAAGDSLAKYKVYPTGTAWYDSVKTTIDLDIDTSKYQYPDPLIMSIGVHNDNVLIRLSGQQIMPEDFNWDTDSYGDLKDEFIYLVSPDNKIVKQHDLIESGKKAGLDMDHHYVSSVQQMGDEALILYRDPVESSWSSGTYVTIDLDTGEITDIWEHSSNRGIQGEFEFTELIGDYKVSFYATAPGNTDRNSYILSIAKNGSEPLLVDLNQKFPQQDISFINTIAYIGEGNGILYAESCNPSQSVSLKINLDTGDVTTLEQDLSYLSCYDNYSYHEEIGSCFVKEDGVYSINTQTMEPECILNFDCTNINRFDISSLNLVSVTGDEFLFAGTVSKSLFDTGESMTLKLSKAETNPNAGKQIITVASTDGLSYAIAEAIRVFNDQSKDYFIVYDDSYSLTNDINVDPDNNNSSEISAKLAIDLGNSDGPDIIVDAMMFPQLNTADYLTDISDLIPAGDYFSNVFEAAKSSDGALWQIPVGFDLDVIYTYKDYINPGQYGFTLDQYQDFVNGPCNGDDPMREDRVDFFVDCIANSYDLFRMSDGTLDFDNNEFRILAEFAKENIVYDPDEDIISYDEIGIPVTTENVAAAREQVNNFYYYIENIQADITLHGCIPFEDLAVMGLPSVDGRGPTLIPSLSVGISSSTKHEEACREFVSLMFSKDIQELVAADCFPVLKSALEDISGKVIENHNMTVESNLKSISRSQMLSWGMDPTIIDGTSVAYLADIIDHSSAFISEDNAVLAIVCEEIQPYFEDQKSLDETIDLIQNRVKTLNAERR